MFLLQQQQQHGQESSAGRIHFQFDSHPALLLLSNVGDPDEGDYRCRVDFGRSPTRNVLVQLTVVGKQHILLHSLLISYSSTKFFVLCVRFDEPCHQNLHYV
jgi:hypothetical protein